jgi:hypothetical protein
MRLWMLVVAVLVVGILLAILRDEFGRIVLIVFLTGLGTVAAGLTSIMALFQTIGALGESKTIARAIEALAATLVVVAVGSASVLGVMFAGALLIQWVIP